MASEHSALRAAPRRAAARRWPLGGCGLLDKLVRHQEDAAAGQARADPGGQARASRSMTRRAARSSCRRRCAMPTGRRPAAIRRTSMGHLAAARHAWREAWSADIGEGGGYRRKITGPAGGRRRPRLHHGQRRRGLRLRRRPRRPGLAHRHRRPRTTAAPMSAAASRSTAARSTRPPAWPSCWRWMPPTAPSAGAPSCRRAGALGADHRRRAAVRRHPRATSCWRSSTDDGQQAVVASGRQSPTTACSACRRRPSPTGWWWPASAPATWSALRADSGTVAWSDSLAAARGRTSLVDLSGDPRPAGDQRRPGLRDRPRRPDASRSTCAAAGACGSATSPRPRRRGSPATGCSCCSAEQVIAGGHADDGRGGLGHATCRAGKNTEKQQDPIPWIGPVLAGDRLIVAGTNAQALAVSPYTGEILGRAGAVRRRARVRAGRGRRHACSWSPTTATLLALR